MAERPEKETRGAWVVHHGRKISLDLSAPSEFPILDESAKAADLLMRLAQSDEATLTTMEVDAVAKAASLNPRSELPHYLKLLTARRLIDTSTMGEVRVLGLIQLFPAGGGMFRMKLLKREVGELARVVLKRGDANAETLKVPLASPMTSYIGPEPSRVTVRRQQRK